MEKKINKFIKRIEILENPLFKLNEFIEEKCINSSVLILCDYLTYKNYKQELLNLEKQSVNNIVLKVLNNNELKLEGEAKLNKILNETFSLIVGIGEFTLLKFVENFAIKTNISYAFVNLFLLKSELFCQNLLYFYNKTQYFPPHFVLINKKEYSNEDIFNIKLNIFKYYYLFLEYGVNIQKQENLKGFLLDYKKILSKLNDNNLINSLIALGLILNKYNINFFIQDYNKNEFYNFLCSTFLISIYQTIFSKISINNLYFSRIYKFGKEKIINFQNFDFNFNKFYLMSIKTNINKISKTLNNCLINFCDNLKSTSLKSFYCYSNGINANNVIDTIKCNKKELFLSFLENFEIFNF